MTRDRIYGTIFIALAAVFCMHVYFDSKYKTERDIIAELEGKASLVKKINAVHPYHENFDYGFFSSYYATESEIKEDLIKAISKKRAQRYWSRESIDNTVKILAYFHNSDYYEIDYRIMIAIFSAESSMNPTAISRVNTNGTRDYGIGQHNSCCIDQRYLHAIALNKQLNIINPALPNQSRTNLYSGAIATAQHLFDNRQVVLAHNERNYFHKISVDQWIVGYNMGIMSVVNGRYRHEYINLIDENYRRIML